MAPRKTWVIRRFGRRGVFLAMFGAIYLAVGVSVATIESQRFSSIAPFVGPLLDSRWWGLMWLAAGFTALGVGARRTLRFGDGPGFVALLVPPAVWTIFYAASVAAFVATGGDFGNIRSVSGAMAWSIVWSVVLLVAGWPDPDRTDRGA
jgi:hypothetical protein